MRRRTDLGMWGCGLRILGVGLSSRGGRLEKRYSRSDPSSWEVVIGSILRSVSD
jgi:hypothetical protein